MALLTIIDFPSEPNDFDIKGDAGFVAANAGGDTLKNDGQTGLYVQNTSGVSIDLIIDAPRKCSQGFLHDVTITVENLFDGFVALDLDSSRFSDDSGVVSLTYSQGGLNVGAVRRP